MDIDMSALRLLEREREIPLDLLIPTIEQALLVAYHKTPGAFEKARAELDRKSGHVTIWATEIDDDGVTLVPEITVKKGMKAKQGEPIKLPFDKIRSGKVEIEFSHLDEAGLKNADNGPSEEA